MSLYHHMRRLNARLATNLKRGKGPTGTVLVLTTTGRRSGLPRDTPLQFEEVDGVLHVASARGTAADWYRNAVADPRVRVTVRGREFAAPHRLCDAYSTQRAALLQLVRGVRLQGSHTG